MASMSFEPVAGLPKFTLPNYCPHGLINHPTQIEG